MDEINASPFNGYQAVSLFSGCGGSSLGYRMAGFKVLWASEFIPEAAACYRANFPDTKLDGRDIRQVKPEEILEATGLNAGELDLLDGSPPCASFSTAGKREAGWGKVKAYSSTKQRTDDLFFEYARILEGVKPRMFVAENVSGLVKGTAKGYFKEILAALKACSYRVRAQVLDAQWLGVPQMRQRLIFMGVREDLNAEPAFPKPLLYRYSVRDALPHIMRQGDNGGFGTAELRDAGRQPSPTIGAGPSTGNGRAPAALVEVAVLSPTVERMVEGLKETLEEHAPDYAADRRARIVDESEPSPSVLTHPRGWNQIALQTQQTERRKFTIAELKRICAFPDDFILTGTYAQQWERLGRAVPPLMMRAIAEAARGVLESAVE